MRIAILIPTLKAGGAEKQAVLLASLLSKRSDVHMILYEGDLDAISLANLKGVESCNIKLHKLYGGLMSKTKLLYEILNENNVEILFNYLTKPNFIGAIVAKIAKVKSIYNGIRNSRIEWWKLLLERFAHNYFASATIYNCYSGAQYFSNKGLTHSKAIVIPNCFPNISAPIIRKDKEVKHIVTVGRFVPQKDYLTIIRSVAELKKFRSDFVMEIIGYGDEEQKIRLWIKEYDVEDNIKIFINPCNVQEIVRDSDIYLSTSLFEGTSNSIMEALNWSLPVVATNVGDNNYLVLDGKTGNLHPIGDYKGIASSLSTLLESLDLRNSYGVAGNQNLKDNYSIEVFEQRYLKLIEV